MNNISNDSRSLITKSSGANLLFISTMGPPSQAWDQNPNVKTRLGKGRAAHPTSGMARQKRKEVINYEPLWKVIFYICVVVLC